MPAARPGSFPAGIDARNLNLADFRPAGAALTLSGPRAGDSRPRRGKRSWKGDFPSGNGKIAGISRVWLFPVREELRNPETPSDPRSAQGFLWIPSDFDLLIPLGF